MLYIHTHTIYIYYTYCTFINTYTEHHYHWLNILFDELYYEDNLFKLIYDNSSNNNNYNTNSNINNNTSNNNNCTNNNNNNNNNNYTSSNNNNNSNNNNTSNTNNNNSNNNNYTSNTNNSSSNGDRYYLNIHYLQWYYNNNITYNIEQWLCQPPVRIPKLTYKYIPTSSTTNTTSTTSNTSTSTTSSDMNVYDMLLALEPGSLLPSCVG